MSFIRSDYLESFTAQIDVQPDGCWIWRGRTNTTSPYGHCYVGVRDERWAHRVAYRHVIGEVPPGLELDHLCNVPLCVNPFHLEPVTPQENMRRAAARRPSPEHGSLSAFWRGCRCGECHSTGLTYQREYIARIRREAAAGQRVIRHGTFYAYAHLACRCSLCREAARELARQRPDRTGLDRATWEASVAAQHGTTSMYTKYRCRCDECRENWNDYWREHRRKKRESAA